MRSKIKSLINKLVGLQPWEEQVSIASFDSAPLNAIDSAKSYVPDSFPWSFWSDEEQILELPEDKWQSAIDSDSSPLPATSDREGYYGADHFKYWASGLREMSKLVDHCGKLGVNVRSYLDFGCATGRIVRHFACQREMDRVCGIDINRRHIEWINKYLPPNIEAAQTTSIPTLPFADNSFDLVTAFSVFTHIEAFETAWLLEIQRILKPGGVAWLTVHSDATWHQMAPDWPLYGALRNHPEFQPYLDASNRTTMPEERLVFRVNVGRSYTSNVFFTKDYLNRVWSRFFEVVELLPRTPDFQDVMVMRKR